MELNGPKTPMEKQFQMVIMKQNLEIHELKTKIKDLESQLAGMRNANEMACQLIREDNMIDWKLKVEELEKKLEEKQQDLNSAILDYHQKSEYLEEAEKIINKLERENLNQKFSYTSKIEELEKQFSEKKEEMYPRIVQYLKEKDEDIKELKEKLAALQPKCNCQKCTEARGEKYINIDKINQEFLEGSPPTEEICIECGGKKSAHTNLNAQEGVVCYNFKPKEEKDPETCEYCVFGEDCSLGYDTFFDCGEFNPKEEESCETCETCGMLGNCSFLEHGITNYTGCNSWEPKWRDKKLCETCKYKGRLWNDTPCIDCDDASDWEAKRGEESYDMRSPRREQLESLKDRPKRREI